MNIYDLISIPVYATNEESFIEKWNTFREKYINKLLGKSYTMREAKDMFVKFYSVDSLWRYNKIIGYIELVYNVRTGDIEFNVYKSLKKKIFYNKRISTCFDKIAYVGIAPNMHVYVRNISNKKIIELIHNELNYIFDIYFKKNNYIDLSCLNNLCNYINFKKITEDYGK